MGFFKSFFSGKPANPEEEKQKSWENIFDISCSFEGEVHPHLSTQATMWEIKRKWVKKAEYFVSR